MEKLSWSQNKSKIFMLLWLKIWKKHLLWREGVHKYSCSSLPALRPWNIILFCPTFQAGLRSYKPHHKDLFHQHLCPLIMVRSLAFLKRKKKAAYYSCMANSCIFSSAVKACPRSSKYALGQNLFNLHSLQFNTAVPNSPSCFHSSLLTVCCARALCGAHFMRSVPLYGAVWKSSGSSTTTQVRVICLHLLWMSLSLDRNTKQVKWLWVYVQNHWLYANFCPFAENIFKAEIEKKKILNN